MQNISIAENRLLCLSLVAGEKKNKWVIFQRVHFSGTVSVGVWGVSSV